MLNYQAKDPTALLPNELLVHIATYLDIPSLARLERVSKAWNALLKVYDNRCWAQHVEGYEYNKELSLQSMKAQKQKNSIDQQYWQPVKRWKDFVLRQNALAENWTTDYPNVETSVVGYTPAREIDPIGNPAPITYSKKTGEVLPVIHAGPASSYVWRARLDPAPDAQFIITTWLSGGVRVIDARPDGNSAVLWQLPRWSVRAYAHLEYRDGIACWDSEDGIEVWKRWKLVQGEETAEQDEPANKRGSFVKVGTVPDMPGMRGFMLNEALHLSVVSSAGRSCTYNVAAAKPESIRNFPIKENASWVYDFGIRRGATGHIEHDLDNVVFCMGHDGYSVYNKETATHLGDLRFNEGGLLTALEQCVSTNYMFIDFWPYLPKRQEDSVFRREVVEYFESNEQALHKLHGTSETDESLEPPELLPELRRNRKPHIRSDEWGATMIRQLDDGATLIVARSAGGRFLFCTDLLGLLKCIEEGSQEMLDAKVRECLAIIECGGTRCITEFRSGGWLTVHAGRAAWEIEDRVYIIELPRKRNTIPGPNTKVMTMNGRYNGEIVMPQISVPASILSLHDDCLVSTYLHPAYILLEGEVAGQARWETSVLKSVRIVRFAPKALEPKVQPPHHDPSAIFSPDYHANRPQLGRRALDVHQQWYITSRLMAGNAIRVDDDNAIWADMADDEEEFVDVDDEDFEDVDDDEFADLQALDGEEGEGLHEDEIL
ncbi:uncharacterized protein FA14DRAFT_192928 [Meira miltonrushii]|uniref:F-box domain-containing protein n=1 Tax=Meira miltonrushii TaxID=1280837 RepID=A0A316V4M4_9BASI|nr:uncharacterized protein FA14DRAFT_192928 [Meira miltonrushii]PWN31441.1 hypothetical protein FA14DRAFT_192928 [Meira miltonrushii]